MSRSGSQRDAAKGGSGTAESRADERTAGVSPALAGVLPSLADVLGLEVITAADPEVVVGAELLDRPVRWVHVTETASVAGLVSGGELLLSTGMGWAKDESELDAYVADLVEAGVTALLLELGRRFTAPPPTLVAACRSRGMPLVVLHRETRFIGITEAVHVRIIADQMNALRARDEIHALFTELSLRGSPADFIVAELGRVLASPVVLEDLGHRVVAVAAPDDGDEVVHDWEQRSRAAHRAAARGARAALDSEAEWLIVPVEARGTRWGHLVALPGEQHPAGRRNVLEQAAIALALSRLADRDADEWVRQSQHELLTILFAGRFRTEQGLLARFEAAGLPIAGRRLLGLAIGNLGGGGVAVRTLESEDAHRVEAAIRGAARDAGAEAIVGARAPGQFAAALSFSSGSSGSGGSSGGSLSDRAAVALANSVASAVGSGELSLAIGSDARDIQGLLASLDEASELLGRGAHDGQAGQKGPARRQGIVVLRAENRPLLRLVTSLGADPRLQAHSELMLRPLIEYDLAHGGDLLDVLAAYAAHPGNRTRAAATSHLSRSVFYQRIALIEDLLGADLDDGETVSALHAALLVRRRFVR